MDTPNDDKTNASQKHEKKPSPVISRRQFRQLSAPQREEDEAAPATQESENLSAGMTTTEITAGKPPKRYQFLPAFWTITGVISLVVNILLIVVLVSVASQLFALKAVVKDQLINGLATNFRLMDEARIQTVVNVTTKVPAKFTLPVDTETIVTLSKDTPIKTARVTLTTGGLQITNAPASIILPAGTQLPIELHIVVPVNEQIPVSLTVPVEIPLSETELHKPFVGLQNVVRPYQTLLNQVPGSWKELICGQNPSDLCSMLVP